jgi:hypothetical protein
VSAERGRVAVLIDALIWRPQALRALEAIEAYYEEVAPDFAPLFVVGAF